MSKDLIAHAKRLVKSLKGNKFGGDVSIVYNPLEYAWKSHEQYLVRYGQGQKKVLMLGMNPGPWGMSQTGVPFGEIAAVRDWMGIEEEVEKPKNEHAKRPIEGFACTRSEVSGKRLWGLFAERFESADSFFEEHFVVNFCPLVWMGESGKNITPDKLPAAEMEPVYAACRQHLKDVIETLQPEWLIGVGAFAEKQLATVVKAHFPEADLTVGKVLHPSPASPAANRGWAEAATKQLIAQGVWTDE